MFPYQNLHFFFPFMATNVVCLNMHKYVGHRSAVCMFSYMVSVCFNLSYVHLETDVLSPQRLCLFLSHAVWMILKFCDAVELLLYSPKRPIVDFSVIFLWMMAVGTLACASLWSEFTAPERTDERYNELSPKVSFYIKLFFILFFKNILFQSSILRYKEALNICVLVYVFWIKTFFILTFLVTWFSDWYFVINNFVLDTL